MRVGHSNNVLFHCLGSAANQSLVTLSSCSGNSGLQQLADQCQAHAELQPGDSRLAIPPCHDWAVAGQQRGTRRHSHRAKRGPARGNDDVSDLSCHAGPRATAHRRSPGALGKNLVDAASMSMAIRPRWPCTDMRGTLSSTDIGLVAGSSS